MKRLAQGVVLLIGVLLVVVSAHLTRQRESDEAVDMLLMTAIRDGHDSVYLVGADSGSGAWRAIGPEYAGFSPKGRSPDGQWVYLMESIYNNPLGIPYGENVRVRANGTQAERLQGVNVTGPLFWSVDGAWAYYAYYDAALNQNDLYRMSADGSQVENLTPGFTWYVQISDYSAPVIDPNGAWIIFQAGDYSSLVGVMRLDLATGQVWNLNPRGIDQLTLVGGTADAAWVVVQTNGTLYRMRPDGSEFTALSYPGASSWVIWGEAGVALTTVYETDGRIWLYALGIDDGLTYWKAPNVYLDYLPRGPRLLLRANDNWVYIGEADRSHPRRLLQLPADAYLTVPSPDGAWLVYQQAIYDPSGVGPSQYILWAAATSGGAPRQLLHSTVYASVVGWSADGAALFVEANTNGRRTLWRIDLATGEKTRLLKDQQYGYFLGVVGQRKWGAWVCMPLLGLGLIGAAMGSGAWSKLRVRYRPA